MGFFSFRMCELERCFFSCTRRVPRVWGNLCSYNRIEAPRTGEVRFELSRISAPHLARPMTPIAAQCAAGCLAASHLPIERDPVRERPRERVCAR